VRSTSIEKLQQLHYDRINSQYEAHYGDACSQRYRQTFIHEPLFDGIELSGMDVLEAMCGNGQTTEFLLSRGARVTGLDISNAEIHSFRERWSNCDARCASIFDSGFASSSFDCVAAVGGLHHLQPNIGEAISEIQRVLKVGGYFCFAEPHQGSFPDLIRAFWYKHDNLFASNEASIDLQVLKKEFFHQFSVSKELYLGNVAYLLVLNSMIFRIPVRFKRFYTPTLMRIESLIDKFQGRRFSCFVVSQWRKL